MRTRKLRASASTDLIDDETGGSNSTSPRHTPKLVTSNNQIAHSLTNGNGNHQNGAHDAVAAREAAERAIVEENKKKEIEAEKQAAILEYIHDLTTKISNLPANSIDYSKDFFHPTADLKKITILFRKLCALDKKNLTDAQLTAVQSCKLSIMHIVSLQAYAYGENHTLLDKKAGPVHYTAFGVLFVLGLIYSFVETFTGSFDLFFNLIGVSEPTSFSLSIGLAFFSNVLFCALEAQGFMEEIGIKSFINLSPYIQIASDKLKVANAYSKTLRAPQQHFTSNIELYQDNFNLLKEIQADILKDKADFTPNEDSFINKYIVPALKMLFSLAGAVLFSLGGVIIARDLVANIAGLTFGTTLALPIIGAIYAVLALAGFALFYALQHRGSVDLFDSWIGRPNELKTAHEAFENDINQNIQSEINNITSQQSDPVIEVRRLQSKLRDARDIIALRNQSRLGTSGRGFTTTLVSPSHSLSTVSFFENHHVTDADDAQSSTIPMATSTIQHPVSFFNRNHHAGLPNNTPDLSTSIRRTRSVSCT
jgi:hypothetical protein